MSDKIQIKLHKPIGENKEIKELNIREPLFRDLRTHGLPVDKDGQLDFSKAGNLLEALTGVQRPFLDMMSAKDSFAVIKEMTKTFGLDEEAVGN